MKNNIKIFDNEDFGSVRTIVEGDVVLFVASDVAKALGYSNFRDAVSRHCRGVVKRDIATAVANANGTIEGKTQQTEMSMIKESDIYRLIIKSKLPSAEKFEAWVFEEVLPQIRKTGSYISERDQLLIGLFSNDPLVVASSHKSLVELEKKPLLKEIEHKEDVIEGLVDDIDLSTQRQRITQIIRFNSTNYADRYNLLYKEFELKYHIDLNRRLKSDKALAMKPKVKNKMDYIDRVMNKIPQLYELACVVFETDVDLLKQEWNDTRGHLHLVN